MSKSIKDISGRAKDPEKYVKLLGLLFVSFISFLLALVILFFFMRLIFKLLPFISWIEYIYMVVIIAVPATLFVTVFSIFFKRTKNFNPKLIRYISLTIFVAIILAWLIIFVADIISFFKFEKTDIKDYLGFNMYFLSLNIALIFLIGIAQALAVPKKEEWLDKLKRHNQLDS